VNTELLNDEYKEICRRFTRSESECEEVYQEAFSRVWDKEVEDLKSYWFITVRNITQRTDNRIKYCGELPDICNRDNYQTSHLLLLLEGDLQRSETENERICKYIVWNYIKIGSVRGCAKELGLSRTHIYTAINDYINNSSIGKLVNSFDVGESDRRSSEL